MTTNTPMNLSAIEFLVLTRLLVVGEKGEAGSKIKKDLEPLLAHRWVGAALTERIDQSLAALESTGLVVACTWQDQEGRPQVRAHRRGPPSGS